MSAALVSDLLRSSAERHGGRPAVIDGDRALSYTELDDAATRVAGGLEARGVVRGDRVALLLDKSPEAVAVIHGILRAGAAYVPLDPQAPPARLDAITRSAGPRLVVTAAQAAELMAHEGGPPDVGSRPDDVAYILYTSGSTGEPKGVTLSHRNAMTFVGWAARQFAVSPEDRLSSHAPLHFDLSTFDLFAAAAAGAAMVLLPAPTALFPAEVARWIAGNAITVWYSVPSALTALVDRGGLKAGALPSLRCVLFAGEVFPPRHLARLMALVPGARFCNLYGPTETNVCTWYEVPALDGSAGAIPIGRPIDGVEVIAIGDDGLPVARGEAGELCVAGPSVMRGYWGDEAQTARVLGPGGMYRTGDRARQDADGNWLFLGRRDAQVKRRGYRIELGEIERALQAHPAVVECVVRAQPDELAGVTITAYVVTRDGVTETDLAGACLERIPRYALPDAFDFRAALPKTSTGKIDGRALLAS